MKASEILEKIETAFAAVKWQYSDHPEPSSDAEEYGEIADDIYLFNTEVQKYYLPRLMNFVVKTESYTNRLRCLERLINFLDVDFDDPGGTGLFLKECKQNEVSDYTEQQSLAIYSWLRYVIEIYGEKLFIDDKEQGLSALKYWRNRAGTQIESDESQPTSGRT